MRCKKRTLRIRAIVIRFPNHGCRVRVTDVVGECVRGAVRAARGNHVDGCGGDFDRGKVPAEGDVLSNFVVCG